MTKPASAAWHRFVPGPKLLKRLAAWSAFVTATGAASVFGGWVLVPLILMMFFGSLYGAAMSIIVEETERSDGT